MENLNIIIEKSFLTYPDALYTNLMRKLKWDKTIGMRKTASFGVPYNYSGLTYKATGMQPLLLPVCQQLTSYLGFRPNNCLVNYYADGDSTMGKHSDETDFLEPGTGIAIVSIGHDREIVFTNKKDQALEQGYTLTNGSLLYMDIDSQNHWLHSVRKQDNKKGRMSLTFRSILDMDVKLSASGF